MERKTEIVSGRVTASVKEDLDKAAESAGLSRSDFIGQVLEDHVKNAPSKKNLLSVHKKLDKILKKIS